jgi:acetoin utilization deacetylase AcuC-like enzyme
MMIEKVQGRVCSVASSSAFGSTFSRPETILRHSSKALSRYWQVGRWLYSALVVGVIVPALAQGPADLLHYPTVQTLIRFWPATVPVLVAIGGSMIIAWEANRNRIYYKLLERSADNYRQTRQGYRAIAAQLPEHRGTNQPLPPGDAGVPSNSFTIFDQQLYTERANAAAVYSDFISQGTKRILLIVGDGGSGKSTFLLHRMGELSGVLPSGTRPHPCVFINCKLDSLTYATELTAIIKGKLGEELPTILGEGIRGKQHRALVVLVDAINENVALAQDDINVHLTKFAEDYLSKPEYQVYLCVTVRKTYWDEQRRRFASNPTSAKFGWLNYVYLPPKRPIPVPSAETASVLLDDFAEAEFDLAYENYREVYRIEGLIPGERTRSICSNPLMLQVFCISFHDQDIRDLESVRSLVRDLDIFDAYANGALARIAEQVGIPVDEPSAYEETFAERAVRGLLLELALGMVDRGRPFLSDDEVFQIARTRAKEALGLGGLRIQTKDGLYWDGSALKAIISEGIILERGRAVISGRNKVNGIRFVSERYLEYSIGRGLVRRWRVEDLPRDQILADFGRLMEQHIRLRAQGFDNLRLGLGIAVLVAEQSASQLPERLYFDLLQTLARDAEFDWNQLACRIVQQLRTFNLAAQVVADEHRQDVDALLTILDGLAEKNDFVLRWDIELALLHAVDAGHGHAILRHLQTWMKPTAAFSQRLFGGESLGYLFKRRADYRNEVADVLDGIISTATELDFWILRGLMFSVGTMMDALESPAAPGEADLRLREGLELVPGELLRFAHRWWDRSVVLAGQIERDLQGSEEGWLNWRWADESPWTRVNAALAAEQACAHGKCTTSMVGVLRRLWRASADYNPHLSWAAWHVLGVAAGDEATSAQPRSEAAGLRGEIEDEARQKLADDPRAAWVLQAGLPAGQRIPAEVTTPVAVVYHPEYGHTDLHNHPESKERVQAILDFLETAAVPVGQGSQAPLTYVSPYRFSGWDDRKFLRLAHRDGWIRRVQELSRQLALEEKSDIVLESDLEVRAGSYEGAVLAVRGVVCAVDLVLSGPAVRLAIALVRPPGHLAGNKICIFNNVAVAARYGQQVLGDGNGRPAPHVLIVDCDAHHGKSTQDIFYEDDTVLYFSTHQAGVHPGTGRFAERGKDAGAGYIVNVPIPAGSGDRVFAEVLARILAPILDGFRPELIMVSFGTDAYCTDSFSQLELTERSYGELAATLLRYCQEHPQVGVVASLEGGYDMNSMGCCVRQFMDTFCECAPPAGATAAPPESPSSLDRYLLERDAGRKDPAIPESDQRWLADFAALETDLQRQWPA